ncbi:hypothetical protein Naga_100661g2 [Nannochloropsis gaditana]|uniref:Uncharacterized protein n=1 Tax=Nannochloropsis gaditana TaxID=72520 RepID=W7UB07_9STRA|nr:hypothetical protein Naga_100661g2 [Nannochloropsis gaditana]
MATLRRSMAWTSSCMRSVERGESSDKETAKQSPRTRFSRLSIHPPTDPGKPTRRNGNTSRGPYPPQCRAMAGRRRPSKTLPRSTEKPPPCDTEADRSFACVMSGFCSTLGTTREEGLLRKLPNPKPSAIPRRIPARVRLYLLYASFKLSWVVTTWKMAIRWKT